MPDVPANLQAGIWKIPSLEYVSRLKILRSGRCDRRCFLDTKYGRTAQNGCFREKTHAGRSLCPGQGGAAGDLDGDRQINVSDLNIVWDAANFNRTVGEAENKLTDLNGDGSVNVSDLNIVWDAANFNKGAGNCTAQF